MANRKIQCLVSGSLCLLLVAILATYNFAVFLPQQTSLLKLLKQTGIQAKSTTASSAVTGSNLPREDFLQALREFTAILHDDPEPHALRPWTWKPSRETTMSVNSTARSEGTQVSSLQQWQFDGLSSRLLQEAFGGERTLLLLGDSTLFYLLLWMQRLMLKTSLENQDALRSLNMSQGNNLVYSRHEEDKFLEYDPHNLEIHSKNNSTNTSGTNTTQLPYDIVWKGYIGPTGSGSCELGQVWNHTIQTMRPHTLVVNMGLHWFNLHGANRREPLCFVRMVSNYKEWLEGFVQLAEQAGTKLLLFKTTNFICTKLYRGEYAYTARLYRKERLRQQQPFANDTNNTANTTTTTTSSSPFHQCARYFQQKSQQESLPNKIISNETIWQYCTNATFDEVGAQYLNRQIFDFVKQKQQEQQEEGQSPSSNLTIGIFNDHDLQSCKYSKVEDGRHYHPMNLMRIRLLANMVQALSNNDGTPS